MSVLKPLYCCIAHRDENLSTINLIGFLSKAYQQVVMLLKAQTGLMRQCKQCQLKNMNSMLSSQEHRVEDMGELSKKLQILLDDMAKYMDHSVSQSVIVPDKDESKLNAADIGMTSLESNISENEDMERMELLKSPVFEKKKSKRGAQVAQYPGYSNSTDKVQNKSDTKNEQLEHCDEYKDCINEKSAPATVIEDRSLHNSSALDQSQVDIIQNTPVAQMYKKIGISSLCNVDTSISPTGKRLKQTTIAFTPDRSNQNLTVYKKSLNVKKPLHLSTSSKKRNIGQFLDGLIVDESDDAHEEEIVQDSPKRAQSRSHVKYKLKSTKRSSKNKAKSFASTDENRVPNTPEKRTKTKPILPLKALNTKTMSQLSPPMFSLQKDSVALPKKTNPDIKIFCADTTESDQLLLNAVSSPLLADMKNWSDQDVGHVDLETTENEKIKRNTSNTLQSKRKLFDLTDGRASSPDATYFAPVEQSKEKVIHGVQYKRDHQDCQDKSENGYLRLGSPFNKRNLLSSFDMAPPKDEMKFSLPKAAKTRAERAKVTGVECWECQQYYRNLGLSEEEIKTRKNTCSRHRNKFGERIGTPDGMWDCVFPDTNSSTLQRE